MGEEKDGQQNKPTTDVGFWTKLNPLRRGAPPPVPAERIAVSPEYTAGFFSLLTFSWMTPLISLGSRRTLEINDIWLVNPNRSTHKLAFRLKASFRENHQEGSKRPLIKAIFQTFRTDIVIGAVASLLSSVLLVLVPFVVKFIILFSAHAYEAHKLGTKGPPIGHGVGLVIGISLMQILGSIGMNHFFYRGMMTGGQVRSSLMSIIFDKAMTISSRAKAGGQSLVSLPPSIEPGSEAEKKFLEDQLAKAQGKEQRASGWSNGRIVNLMSTDTYRIDQTCGYFHMVWTSPLSMLITVALLLINLQYSAVVGIVFFFGAVPILGLAARQLMRSRRAINKLTDKRVVITQEVMQAIRFVKYYAWEADFTKRLRAVRKQEIRGIRVLLGIRNLVNVMGTSIPIFASMLTFITYSLSKHPLNPAPVFSSLALFNALRAPLIVLPLIMGLITDALQSIARIEEYLLAEDGMDLIEKETGSKFALELLDASFTWEQNTPDVSAAPSKKEIKQMEKAKKPAKDVKVEAAVSSSPVNSGTLDDPTSSNLVESLSLEARPFALEHINLQVRPSELIAVVGEVGSGKSSLLCAIAGEMRQTSGRVVANGNRALCPQLAWIQNTSLRDNITFGLDFDKTKYDQITEACSLTHDLQVLPNGSLTEIGERGINLSGGQKHRVSLARAVYFDADIILLDDPLAAVDAHVGTHIMDQAICTLLKDKCRILATHQLQVLQRCDRIVVMESGKIIACDTFPHLMAENEKFKEMMATVDKQTAEKPEMEVNVEEVALKKQLTTAKTQVALIQEEDRQVNSISMAVWNDYFRSTGSLLIPPIVLLMLILGQGANIVTSLWLAWWSSNKLHYNTGTYIGIYSGLGILQALLLLGFTLGLTIAGTEASKRMLRRAVDRVLRAPVSFFDTTPQGRIMNRLTKDIDVMDNNLTESMRVAGTTVAAIVSIFILIICYYYFFAVALGPLLVLYMVIASYYRMSARSIKRNEANFRSTVFARFNEAVSGTATIRAYGVQERFSFNLIEAINNMDSAYYLTFSNQRWLCVRLDAIGVVFFFITGMLVISNRVSINPSISGLVLSYLVSLTQSLQTSVRQVADMENNMNATERIHFYGAHIPQEAAAETSGFKLAETWPQKGEIVFEDVQMRYREGLPLILQGINLHIQPGEKVGIVGRTGAGKSSIMNVLFRMTELPSGSITIDGIDISTVGLHDLRSCMSIIPQDPTLFRGTIRSNLDPFNEHTDLDLWSALRQAHLVENNSENGLNLESLIESEGSNLSLGQRQLMALARALVRGSQIIVCDEATSSIDFESDRKVQETIINGFSNKTLLCIAHRLRTIIGYDRVCVVDDGRVAEIDTPLALFDQGGAFRRMCEQSKIGREDIIERQRDIVHAGGRF